MTRFLVAQGVPERDVAPLLDKLADYNDLDNLHRLNGAEADRLRGGRACRRRATTGRSRPMN